MPLRDHFQSSSTLMKWEALYGGWPMMIARRLNSILPEEYIAQPSVRLGGSMEIDVAAFERESDSRPISDSEDVGNLTFAQVHDFADVR